MRKALFVMVLALAGAALAGDHQGIDGWWGHCAVSDAKVMGPAIGGLLGGGKEGGGILGVVADAKVMGPSTHSWTPHVRAVADPKVMGPASHSWTPHAVADAKIMGDSHPDFLWLPLAVDAVADPKIMSADGKSYNYIDCFPTAVSDAKVMGPSTSSWTPHVRAVADPKVMYLWVEGGITAMDDWEAPEAAVADPKVMGPRLMLLRPISVADAKVMGPGARAITPEAVADAKEMAPQIVETGREILDLNQGF